MKSICFLLPVFAVLVLNSGFIPVSNWDTKRESEKIKLQYRRVKHDDNMEYRQFRAVLNISSSFSSFLRNMNEEKRILQWTAKSKKCIIYDKTESEWVTYTLFDIPKPFKQQDIVLKHTVHFEKQSMIVLLEPLPNYLPNCNNVIRLNDFIGYWKVIPEGTNQIKVEFYYLSTKKPLLPRYIVDPILLRVLMDSFTKLIELSEMT